MNYRHAYHAGGRADVFKHAILVAVVERLREKAAPFFYLDTHAGLGRYDLSAVEAQETGEYRAGIGRLLRVASEEPSLARYLALERGANLDPQEPDIYLGSPALVRALARASDRLALCELHPEDVDKLRRQYKLDRQIGIHHRDGYGALSAFLPPKERRGLVFIDPSFEERDELPKLLEALQRAYKRWPAGVYMLWYPIKQRGLIRRFHDALVGTGIKKILVAEFLFEAADDAEKLNGSGLVIVNPPYEVEYEIGSILTALKRLLAPNARVKVEWLVPEAAS
jgi:23S rRNA (adenine2030-N6)-methyltransferase